MKRSVMAGTLTLLLVLSACAPRQDLGIISGPANVELLLNEREVLELPALSAVSDEGYRLIWHPWHGNIAGITAQRNEDGFQISLSHTNGIGTYDIGVLEGAYSDELSSEEYKLIALAFRDIAKIPQQPSLFNETKDGSTYLCIHAPMFLAERWQAGEANWFQRHCHPEYANDFRIVQPLVDAAWRRWPEIMTKVEIVSQ